MKISNFSRANIRKELGSKSGRRITLALGIIGTLGAILGVLMLRGPQNVQLFFAKHLSPSQMEVVLGSGLSLSAFGFALRFGIPRQRRGWTFKPSQPPTQAVSNNDSQQIQAFSDAIAKLDEEPPLPQKPAQGDQMRLSDLPAELLAEILDDFPISVFARQGVVSRSLQAVTGDIRGHLEGSTLVLLVNRHPAIHKKELASLQLKRALLSLILKQVGDRNNLPPNSSGLLIEAAMLLGLESKAQELANTLRQIESQKHLLLLNLVSIQASLDDIHGATRTLGELDPSSPVAAQATVEIVKAFLRRGEKERAIELAKAIPCNLHSAMALLEVLKYCDEPALLELVATKVEQRKLIPHFPMRHGGGHFPMRHGGGRDYSIRIRNWYQNHLFFVLTELAKCYAQRGKNQEVDALVERNHIIHFKFGILYAAGRMVEAEAIAREILMPHLRAEALLQLAEVHEHENLEHAKTLIQDAKLAVQERLVPRRGPPTPPKSGAQALYTSIYKFEIRYNLDDESRATLDLLGNKRAYCEALSTAHEEPRALKFNESIEMLFDLTHQEITDFTNEIIRAKIEAGEWEVISHILAERTEALQSGDRTDVAVYLGLLSAFCNQKTLAIPGFYEAIAKAPEGSEIRFDLTKCSISEE